MCKAVADGSIGYIEYIESKARIQWNWRRYIRYAAYWHSLRSLKYIEEKMTGQNELINWKEVMEVSKTRSQKETEVTIYIEIKLEEL